MKKTGFKNLHYFRIDGECAVSKAFTEEYRERFHRRDDQDIAGAITKMESGRNFGHFLHTCFFKQKNRQKENFHFLCQIDKLKRQESAKDADSELYRKIDGFLMRYDYLYRCNVRIIFRFNMKKFMNVFGFPQAEEVNGHKMRKKGSIFVLESDPGSSFLCETTKSDFVIAKQFKLPKFKYSRDNIDRIIAQNAEIMSIFLKEV